MGYREIGETIPRSSASEWVYQVVRKGITSGELKGGTQLKQDEISEALNCSHIPVREALRRLESEGLVTIYPNRGAQVSKLSRRAIMDMMEIRASLAVMELKTSCKHFTEEDYAEMEACVEGQRNAQSVEEAEDYNNKFHAVLNRYSENVMAQNFLKNIHDNIDRFMRNGFYGDPAHRAISASQHEAIVKAIRNGHVHTSCELLRAHILNAIVYVPEESEL